MKRNRKEYDANYRHSKDGVVSKIYGHQKETSKRRGHTLPTYSKEELKEWLFSQKKFHTLYDNWKRLDFQKEYKPSVDRKKDCIGYTMANIQLMTWGKNKAKFEIQVRKGEAKCNLSENKPTRQYSADGEFIKEYVSQAEAARQTGSDQRKITLVVNGLRKTHNGYRWENAN